MQKLCERGRDSHMAETSFLDPIKSFGRPFWAANVMQLLERLAFYGARVLIPIYIASSEEPNGLHFDNRQKGMILTVWIFLQTLLPIFTGGFADKYGRKLTLATAFGIKVVAYVLMATQRSFWGFFIACQVLAVGTAIFKPGQQGTLACGIREKNSALGWGIFYQVGGVAALFGPPLAGFLHRFAWTWLFLSCAAIMALGFLVLPTYDDNEVTAGAEPNAANAANATNVSMRERSAGAVLVHAMKTMLRPRLLTFILALSGFWGVLYQMFDSMPNFIEEWVDSRDLVAWLGIHEGWFAVQTPRGLQIPQEMFITVDATAIVLLTLPVSAISGRLGRLGALVAGAVIMSMGLLLAGVTTMGTFCLLGVFVFAIGELLGAPKMWEYLAAIAPRGEEALYMGYSNVPSAIGVTAATYAAGILYDRMADKANLALRYIGDHGLLPADRIAAIPRTQAMAELQNMTHLDATAATRLLWDTYHPHTFWFPFVGMGLASAAAIIVYARHAARWEREKTALAS